MSELEAMVARGQSRAVLYPWAVYCADPLQLVGTYETRDEAEAVAQRFGPLHFVADERPSGGSR